MFGPVRLDAAAAAAAAAAIQSASAYTSSSASHINASGTNTSASSGGSSAINVSFSERARRMLSVQRPTPTVTLDLATLASVMAPQPHSLQQQQQQQQSTQAQTATPVTAPTSVNGSIRAAQHSGVRRNVRAPTATAATSHVSAIAVTTAGAAAPVRKPAVPVSNVKRPTNAGMNSTAQSHGVGTAVVNGRVVNLNRPKPDTSTSHRDSTASDARRNTNSSEVASSPSTEPAPESGASASAGTAAPVSAATVSAVTESLASLTRTHARVLSEREGDRARLRTLALALEAARAEAQEAEGRAQAAEARAGKAAAVCERLRRGAGEGRALWALAEAEAGAAAPDCDADDGTVSGTDVISGILFAVSQKNTSGVNESNGFNGNNDHEDEDDDFYRANASESAVDAEQLNEDETLQEPLPALIPVPVHAAALARLRRRHAAAAQALRTALAAARRDSAEAARAHAAALAAAESELERVRRLERADAEAAVVALAQAGRDVVAAAAMVDDDTVDVGGQSASEKALLSSGPVGPSPVKALRSAAKWFVDDATFKAKAFSSNSAQSSLEQEHQTPVRSARSPHSGYGASAEPGRGSRVRVLWGTRSPFAPISPTSPHDDQSNDHDLSAASKSTVRNASTEHVGRQTGPSSPFGDLLSDSLDNIDDENKRQQQQQAVHGQVNDLSLIGALGLAQVHASPSANAVTRRSSRTTPSANITKVRVDAEALDNASVLNTSTIDAWGPCPDCARHIAEDGRLKSHVSLLKEEVNRLNDETTTLKAEVARLTAELSAAALATVTATDAAALAASRAASAEARAVASEAKVAAGEAEIMSLKRELAIARSDVKTTTQQHLQPLLYPTRPQQLQNGALDFSAYSAALGGTAHNHTSPALGNSAAGGVNESTVLSQSVLHSMLYQQQQHSNHTFINANTLHNASLFQNVAPASGSAAATAASAVAAAAAFERELLAARAAAAERECARLLDLSTATAAETAAAVTAADAARADAEALAAEAAADAQAARAEAEAARAEAGAARAEAGAGVEALRAAAAAQVATLASECERLRRAAEEGEVRRGVEVGALRQDIVRVIAHAAEEVKRAKAEATATAAIANMNMVPTPIGSKRNDATLSRKDSGAAVALGVSVSSVNTASQIGPMFQRYLAQHAAAQQNAQLSMQQHPAQLQQREQVRSSPTPTHQHHALSVQQHQQPQQQRQPPQQQQQTLEAQLRRDMQGAFAASPPPLDASAMVAMGTFVARNGGAAVAAAANMDANTRVVATPAAGVVYAATDKTSMQLNNTL